MARSAGLALWSPGETLPVGPPGGDCSPGIWPSYPFISTQGFRKHSEEILPGKLASKVLDQQVGDVGFTRASSEIDNYVVFLSFFKQLILVE